MQLQAQNATFVDGSVQQVAGASDNGSPVAESASTSADTASFAIVGPVDAGQLTTSQWTVDITPGDGATSVTMVALGWNATANTAGGALADTCSLPSDPLASTSVEAATTTTPPTTATTTTTAISGPTSTVAVRQTTTHGSSTDSNACTASIDPPLQPPSTTDIGVTLATDAFPQPHKGDPITLSKTALSVSVPATLLQLGVDAGLIKNGDKVPSKVDLVVDGSKTTEATHDYKVNATAVISVVGGKAQPLKATLALPNTTWHPANTTDPVFFSEQSMTIVSNLNLPGLGAVTATFSCKPSKATTFVALAAQGTALPVVPGGSTSGTTPVGAQTAGAVASAATGSAGELPRTGAAVWPLLIAAVLCIELGLLAARASKRART